MTWPPEGGGSGEVSDSDYCNLTIQLIDYCYNYTQCFQRFTSPFNTLLNTSPSSSCCFTKSIIQTPFIQLRIGKPVYSSVYKVDLSHADAFEEASGNGTTSGSGTTTGEHGTGSVMPTPTPSFRMPVPPVARQGLAPGWLAMAGLCQPSSGKPYYEPYCLEN